MATLTVWSFPDAFGADDAETLLKGLRDLRLITIHDAAVVSWPAGNKQPTTRRLSSLKSWLQANNATGMAVLLLVMGVSLVGKGLGGLL
jgi:uncharacterized membrane protein